MQQAPVAQLDRALVSGTKGRRFESSQARHFLSTRIGRMARRWHCTKTVHVSEKRSGPSVVRDPVQAEPRGWALTTNYKRTTRPSSLHGNFVIGRRLGGVEILH